MSLGAFSEILAIQVKGIETFLAVLFRMLQY